MTGNKSYFRISILVLIAIISWTSYHILDNGKEEESYPVSVIVDDSNHDRWIALRLGLEQAARDYQIDLNYVFTGKLTSAEEEKGFINRELENGAKGIIVQMISSEEDAVEMGEILSKAAFVLLESDVKPENLYALVEPDNVGIGKAIADAVKQDFGEELNGKKIGILSGNQNQVSLQQRLSGVEEGFMEEAVDIVWRIENRNAMERDNLQLAEAEAVDLIIALENDETEKMVDYMLMEENADYAPLLYGVGCSEKTVYYLNKGIIRTLVVPNEFNMGYQSMEAMANQLQYHSDKAESSQVDYLVIDRTNMYDKENQKVLFPIVQ